MSGKEILLNDAILRTLALIDNTNHTLIRLDDVDHTIGCELVASIGLCDCILGRLRKRLRAAWERHGLCDSIDTVCERLVASRALVAELRRVLMYLVDDGWLNDIHVEGCPEDDTCTCPIVEDINRVLSVFPTERGKP